MRSFNPVSAISAIHARVSLRIRPETRQFAIQFFVVQAGSLLLVGGAYHSVYDPTAALAAATALAAAGTAALAIALATIIIYTPPVGERVKGTSVVMIAAATIVDVAVMAAGTPDAYFIGVAVALAAYLAFSRIPVQEPDAGNHPTPRRTA